MPSIFSKIIAGEIPSHRVYEDDHVFAFLDIGPVSRGHTLVVPREEAETIDTLSDDAAAALGRVLPRIVRGVKAATGVRDLNILQNNGPTAGQLVMHVHFHVIPRYPEHPDAGGGLEVTWDPHKLEPEEGEALAKRIAAAIG
jgi:histidine triad (HIT) family protein